jgi:hypothetical protein
MDLCRSRALFACAQLWAPGNTSLTSMISVVGRSLTEFQPNQANFPYMVDNQHNYFQAAPDKGQQNGPVWTYSQSLGKYMSNLATNNVIRGGYGKGLTPGTGSRPRSPLNETHGSNGTVHLNRTRAVLSRSRSSPPLQKRASNYWLTSLAPLGSVSASFVPIFLSEPC